MTQRFISQVIFLMLGLFFTLNQSYSQSTTYSCQNSAFEYLELIKGNWKVMTKDRTSPGVYEKNEGKSVISDLISGCGIKESFRGTYKNKAYARETLIIGKDSINIQMSILDSEHNSFMILNGKLEKDEIVVYWYRNDEVKKLQSKYLLSIENKNKFEFSSYLSTDYGKNWALTHQREYSRIY